MQAKQNDAQELTSGQASTMARNEQVVDTLTGLCCDVLCCAVLCCAVLCCAVLCCAVLCCAVPIHLVPVLVLLMFCCACIVTEFLMFT